MLLLVDREARSTVQKTYQLAFAVQRGSSVYVDFNKDILISKDQCSFVYGAENPSLELLLGLYPRFAKNEAALEYFSAEKPCFKDLKRITIHWSVAPDNLKFLLRFQSLDKVFVDQSTLFLRSVINGFTPLFYRELFHSTLSREYFIPTNPNPRQFERSWNQLKADDLRWNPSKGSLEGTASQKDKTAKDETEDGRGEKKGTVAEYLPNVF